jgi:sugar phosphate isomerase/epimerase
MRTDQIAVQLYTLRDLVAADLDGTLQGVADAGYRAVELAGLPPMPAEDLRDRLDRTGLRPMASHESLEGLRLDLGGVLDRMVTVGCPRIIVPWLPDAERATAGGARTLARELGGLAGRCADRGIRFGYHNHAFEFAPLDGTTIWQVLLDELPDAVDLELDVYWATVGGRDPVELIAGVGGRVRLLHMKDMSAEPGHGDLTPGDGVLPWPTIVAAGTAAGVEWYVVEEDNPRDALAEIARGRVFLEGLAEADART